jgi:hypothetical protein
MTRASVSRRIASFLIAHASNVLPPSRAVWRQAMKNEIDHIDGDFEVLLWASGCVIASYFQRTSDRSQSFGSVLKRPSAFLPMVMSLVALAVVLFTVTVYGVPHGKDEGAAAHIWQLLMAGQVPLLLFFAIKWLPRAPKETLCVLVLQVGAVFAAMAPVFFLHL